MHVIIGPKAKKEKIEWNFVAVGLVATPKKEGPEEIQTSQVFETCEVYYLLLLP
ncbi:hypothetical protein [Algoriphagus namhaensis]